MDRQSDRVAMVFTHHPHEIFATGMVLQYNPDLLFLSHSHSERRLEDQARAGLDAIGFGGTARFLPFSERVAYARMLENDFGWFRAMQELVADWLDETRPATIYTDAFDEHGRSKVVSGQFARALTFNGHFAPIARSLFHESAVMGAVSKAA